MGSCPRNHFYLYNPGTDDIAWARSCKTFPVMTKIVIITILPGQRKRGRSQRQQASKKCRKEKYRDYYIEPDGCRYILSPNPHLHPQDENLCNPAHYDQVGEAVQDVQLCWGRQELRLLHCHQDKAQVILTFLFLLRSSSFFLFFRAVRFVCGDGRKFKKNVVAVRKCGKKKKVGTSFSRSN